jgi:exodeoxyribonuclease VII small subunit
LEKKDKQLDELTFEEAVQELEWIAHKLEDGSLNLDEAISRFERGTELKKFCQDKLEEAERKIEILQKSDSGKSTKKVKKKKVKIKEDTGEIDDKEDLQGSLL